MKGKLKTVHVIRTRYPHWGGHSGIHQFLRHLDPGRFHVEERLAADGDDDFPVRSPAFRRRLRGAIQRRGMPWYKLSDLDAEMRALARCWRGRIDVVHYLDGEHSARFLPGLRPRRAGVVATFHQPPELLGELLSERALRRIDRVTVVSPGQAEWLGQRLGPERVEVILHGIDTDFFRPAPKPEDGVFRCITVGHYLRDFAAIRAVAERLAGRPVEFHVVTDRETGLEDLPGVRRHRGVDDDRLLELYQRADALLLPVHRSTANNALLEGIACGLPVISTRLPSIAAYLPGGEGILIEGNDPDALADAVLGLRDDPRTAREMGRRARRRAEELSWRNLAPRYAQIYAEVAGR